MRQYSSPQRCPLADKTIREYEAWRKQTEAYKVANPQLGFKQRLLRDLERLNG